MSSTMMAHAHGILASTIHSLEDAMGRQFSGRRRLRAKTIDSGLLSVITDSKNEKVLLNNVASTRLTQLRKSYRDTRALTPEQTREKAAEFILWSLLLTRTRDVPKIIPLKHHWLPLCYTKAFGVKPRQGRTAAGRKAPKGWKHRGVMLGQSHFGKDGKVTQETLVPDIFFSHARSERGYYPARMEMFFAQIEGHFSNERPEAEEAWSDWANISLLAFFAVQAARNPEPSKSHSNARFHKDHQSHILSDIFEALDNFTAPHISYVFDGLEFMFTPFFPSRIRFLTDGTKVAVFALSPERAFVLSNRALTKEEADTAAERNAEAMVRHAARTGQPLYGLARATNH